MSMESPQEMVIEENRMAGSSDLGKIKREKEGRSGRRQMKEESRHDMASISLEENWHSKLIHA